MKKKTAFKSRLRIVKAYGKAFLYGLLLHRIVTVRDNENRLLYMAAEDLQGESKALYERRLDEI